MCEIVDGYAYPPINQNFLSAHKKKFGACSVFIKKCSKFFTNRYFFTNTLKIKLLSLKG